MEMRDYLRMLRRGWPAIVLITALILGLTGVYLVLAPKRYDATTVLLLSVNDPQSIDQLQQGNSYLSTATVNYAQLIDSVTILGDVAASMRPVQGDVDQLEAMTTAEVRPETNLIDITVSGSDPVQIADIANRIGTASIRFIAAQERNSAGTDLIRVQQVRNAIEPTQAASPNVKRTLAIGVVVGLCVSLAVTIASQTLDNRIRRVEEVRQIADVPLLAALPRPSRAQRRGLFVRDDPTGAAGEAFRTLRTNVGYLRSTESRRSLLLAAVSEDRDGAQVPANLAWTLAQTGRRILLVDLDLRRSSVGDLFGWRTGVGMSDVLAGKVEVSETLHRTDHPHLSVVVSGTGQPGPSELLSSPAMAEALSWMEQHFDYVIVHAPPVLSFTDAAVISVAVGGTLITVAAGRTRGQDLTTALVALANVRVRPLGLVLTRVHGSTIDLAPSRDRGVPRPRFGRDSTAA